MKKGPHGPDQHSTVNAPTPGPLSPGAGTEGNGRDRTVRVLSPERKLREDLGAYLTMCTYHLLSLLAPPTSLPQ